MLALLKHKCRSHIYVANENIIGDLQYTIMEYIGHILISTKSKVKNLNYKPILNDISESDRTDDASRLSRVMKDQNTV